MMMPSRTPSRLALLGILLVVLGGGLVLLAGRSPRPAAVPAAADREGLSGAEQADLDGFLADYNARYQQLWTAREHAAWLASTDVGARSSERRVEAAQALAEFAGDARVIEQLRRWRHRAGVPELAARQIETAWQLAAHHPATLPDTVAALLRAEAVQADSLLAHEWWLRLPGAVPRRIEPATIDSLLAISSDLPTRQAAWECSKQAGASLRPGLVRLRGLRNAVAQEMGYPSFFDLEAAGYGLTGAEMVALCDSVLARIMPLYEQLHTWARHELARRYEVVPPRLIPAHWLADRRAQSWPDLVGGVDRDALFADVTPSWIVEQAEQFYGSLGFEPLPPRFWSDSDLFPVPPDAGRQKNARASAWHVDLDRDVRVLMSVRNDFRSFGTAHRELGHVYDFLAYAREDVPPILRRGANRAFHEGIGSLVELVATRAPHLRELGLLDAADATDEVRWLLNEALMGPVVFLPFACGTMTHWEYDLYAADLPAETLNARWWEHAAHFQGIAPPAPRGEVLCDPATMIRVDGEPARDQDHALGEVLLHQLHRYICREILGQDVRAASYRGRPEVGRYLETILRLRATRDWKQVLHDATGEDLSAEALVEYFAPLQTWLEAQNAGREIGFR
ncbi:MAG: M2 family metallopeptidase [Candidatus Krumholzibacteriia bacterium]